MTGKLKFSYILHIKASLQRSISVFIDLLLLPKISSGREGTHWNRARDNWCGRKQLITEKRKCVMLEVTNWVMKLKKKKLPRKIKPKRRYYVSKAYVIYSIVSPKKVSNKFPVATLENHFCKKRKQIFMKAIVKWCRYAYNKCC